MERMRRSEWRRRADDPKNLLGWWWRGFLAWDWRIPIGVAGALVSAWASASGLPWYVDSLGFGLAFGCFSGTRRRRDALAPLLSEPAPAGQFRARVAYRREDVLLGRDSMSLTFVEGWLYAEGTRSTFALRAVDVREMPGRFEVGCALRLTDGSVVSLGGLQDRDRRALEAWHRAGEVPEGKPTFPPAKPRLDEVARWLIWSFGGAGLFLLAGFANSFFPRSFPLHQTSFLVGLFGAVAFALGGSRLNRLVAITTRARRQEALADGAPALRELPEPLTAKRL